MIAKTTTTTHLAQMLAQARAGTDALLDWFGLRPFMSDRFPSATGSSSTSAISRPLTGISSARPQRFHRSNQNSTTSLRSGLIRNQDNSTGRTLRLAGPLRGQTVQPSRSAAHR